MTERPLNETHSSGAGPGLLCCSLFHSPARLSLPLSTCSPEMAFGGQRVRHSNKRILSCYCGTRHGRASSLKDGEPTRAIECARESNNNKKIRDDGNQILHLSRDTRFFEGVVSTATAA